MVEAFIGGFLITLFVGLALIMIGKIIEEIASLRR